MMPGEKAGNFKGTMRKLLVYLKPYRLHFVMVFFLTIAGTVFNIISPAILGRGTDTIIQGLKAGAVDYHALLMVIALLGGLYILSYLFNLIQGIIMANVSQKLTYTFRKEMSEKLDRLPVKYFDNMTVGEFQSRMTNDIETVNQSLSQSITQIISSIITIVGILAMMLYINLWMTLLALMIVPLSMGIIRIVVSKSQGHFKNQQAYLGRVNAHVEEMYSGHTVVKVFNREEASQQEFDELNERLFEAGWKSQFISSFMMPATRMIGNMSYVGICILGGWLAIHGRVSIGEIQAFLQYVNSFNQPLQSVANIANMLQSTAAAAERVFEVLDAEEEDDSFDNQPDAIGEGVKHGVARALGRAQNEAEAGGTAASGSMAGGTVLPVQGEVVFDHVSFGYEPGKPVIKDFSFKTDPGSMVAIVGPTGAGKTTLVKLLMRFYELDGGSISVDGVDITTISRKDLRDRFGMVLQDTWLFSGTIRENLKYGAPHASDEEMERAARAAHIHHYIMTQSDGYDTVINEDADNISQGQKQLMTIARAMLADNPILILDEATSSVDTRTERLIQEAMAQLMKGRTTFVIAHRLSTIRDADSILVMDHGDIVETGTHEELLAAGGFYASLYNSQFEH